MQGKDNEMTRSHYLLSELHFMQQKFDVYIRSLIVEKAVVQNVT